MNKFAGTKENSSSIRFKVPVVVCVLKKLRFVLSNPFPRFLLCSLSFYFLFLLEEWDFGGDNR